MKFILNETIIKDVLGQKQITVRELTIKESLELQNLKEEEIMFAMLSKAIVKPKVTIDELNGMPSKYMPDVETIVNTLNGVEPDGSK